MSPPVRGQPGAPGRLWGARAAVFSLAVFVSAALLFLVEPMVGNFVLPLLGSSPAVWTTTVLFFQVMLLAGYAFSHATSRLLSIRSQAIVQIALVGVAAVSLPLATPSGVRPPAVSEPELWLIGLLFVTVGAPFFALAAAGPTLQRWLAATGRDPYFLFAASNGGSLLGLLAYPLLMQPLLDLDRQGGVWTIAYVVAGVLMAVAAAVALGRRPRPAVGKAPTAEEDTRQPDERIDNRRRLRWLALAFVPSSLMLGATSYVTRNLSPVPLLWVVPLALYLVTFIVAFAPGVKDERVVGVARVLLPGVVIVLVYTLVIGSQRPLVLLVVLNLAALAVAGLMCHGQLAADRPSPRHLTEFYLWVGLGGALGGVFNALIAPLVFPTLIEYPLALVAACLLRPPPPKRRPDLLEFLLRDRRPTAVMDVIAPLVVAIAVVLVLRAARGSDGAVPFDLRTVIIGVTCGLIVNFARRPIRFGLAVAAVLLAGQVGGSTTGHVLARTRSFFGTYKVVAAGNGGDHLLFDGNTLHGEERLQPGPPVPLSYYGRAGPAGQAFAELPSAATRSVAVVGLGAGSLACYAHTGERWTFYEIDPVVAGIARDRKLFNYLSGCAGRYRVVVGDGRLSLAREHRARYGVVVVDAFNSDAIPVNLITRQALQLYRARMRSDGALLFHISNRYLNLEPVLANLAADLGLACRVERYVPTAAQQAAGQQISKWAILAKQRADLGAVTRDARWRRCRADRAVGTWTDSYSNLLAVVTWG